MCVTEVGCLWGGTGLLRRATFVLYLTKNVHGLESSKRNRAAAVEADVIGQQQLKRTQSGSTCSSRSGRDRELQLHEADASGEQQTQSGSSSGGKGEQQLKWMPQSGPRAAAEADASGE